MLKSFSAALVFILLTSLAQAQDHTGHGRFGSHGMVLFSDGVSLYVSHLPLYRAPHDYQILYRIRTPQQKRLMALLADSNYSMVTVLPDAFDLNRLVEGEQFTISTTVFAGHFERGGKPVFVDADFHFEAQVYLRHIGDLAAEPAGKLQVLEAASARSIAVHRIQAAPSFDMIALLDAQGCQTDKANAAGILDSRVKRIDRDAMQAFLAACGAGELIYFETKDFEA